MGNDIHIKNQRIEQGATSSRLVADIVIQGKPQQLWFEVDNQYADCLVTERSDAFVIGVFHKAMELGCNVWCDTPMSEELHYQMMNHLIPAMAKNSQKLKSIIIHSQLTDEIIPNKGAVATGVSCGVDSLHCILEHIDTKYNDLNLTHLTMLNVGAFFHKGCKQFEYQTRQAKAVAKELGLKLVVIDSNINDVLDENFGPISTFRILSAVYAVRTLFGVYYLSSAGWGYEYFTLKDNEIMDAACYDTLICPMLSVKGLVVYSGGGADTRLVKTKKIANNKLAQQYLHVCDSDDGPNCNTCDKCRRTMVTLDMIGSLDEFANAFDVRYYQDHRREYIEWMVRGATFPCQHKDLYMIELFNVFKKDLSWSFLFLMKLKRIWFCIRVAFCKVEWAHRLYRRLFR